MKINNETKMIFFISPPFFTEILKIFLSDYKNSTVESILFKTSNLQSEDGCNSILK